jgi:hypothetical protein
MTHKTYASTARDTLGTLQEISAKLDRLIDLIAVNRAVVESPARSTGPGRWRLAS